MNNKVLVIISKNEQMEIVKKMNLGSYNCIMKDKEMSEEAFNRSLNYLKENNGINTIIRIEDII